MTAFSAKKDQQLFADLLLDIESRHDVNAMRIEGVHLWPLARLIIGRAFKGSNPIEDAGLSEDTAARAAADPAGFPANKGQRARIRQAHRQETAEAADVPVLLARQRTAAASLKDADFVVLSKIEKYYEKIGDKRYAPILDPVIEDLRVRGRTEVLGLEPIPFACVNEPHRIDIEPYLLTERAPKLRPPAQAVDGLREINDFIRGVQPDYCFEVDDVLRRYRRIAHRAGFFGMVFDSIRPKCIFLSSFTGWLHAVLAARRLGIPTVDIQHGGQGPIHYPTTHLSRLPADGYDVMPDVFWLWGQMNLEYASPWLPGGASRHVPVVGGNRKVAHWYKRRDAGVLDASDRAYLERFAGRPVVLVTLSYGVDRLLPEPLVEAMRRTPEMNWHVRLHPIHRTREAAEQIRAHLETSGCMNFRIDEPTYVQLPTALSVSVAHITPFSTAGIEAVAMGVPTLIAHAIGAKLFRQEIDAGILSFADDADGIERWVRAAGAAGVDEAHRRRYVEIDDRAVDRVIETAYAIRRKALPRATSLSGRLRSWLVGGRAAG